MSAFLIKLFGNILGSLAMEHPALGLPLLGFLGILAATYRRVMKIPPPPLEFPPETPASFIGILQRSVEAGEPIGMPVVGQAPGHHRLVRVLYYDRERIRAFDPATGEGVTYRWADLDLNIYDGIGSKRASA